MTTLIFSLPGDVHALATKWAIDQLGPELARIICWGDFPQLLEVSYEVDSGELCQTSIGDLDLARVSSLWNHRTMRPVAPAQIDPADHSAIQDGGEILFKGLVAQVEKHAFAVNSSRSKAYIDNKLTQLREARRAGFRIPRTLVSNDLRKISDFVSAHRPCIVKPLRFMRWRGEAEVITLYTRSVPELDDLDPLAVTACPMIYQQKIDKSHELRVVVFGSEVVAFRLESQDDQRSSTDWRAVDYRQLRVEPELLAPQLVSRILSFVRSCGLAACSIDMAVEPNGEFVFFEVNETGQFLWLEELCPEIPLLDMFARFLMAGSTNFTSEPRRSLVTLEDWKKAAPTARIEDLELHVDVDLDKRYKDRVEC